MRVETLMNDEGGHFVGGDAQDIYRQRRLLLPQGHGVQSASLGSTGGLLCELRRSKLSAKTRLS